MEHKIVNGIGNLEGIVSSLGIKKPIIVCGKSLLKLSIYPVIDSLKVEKVIFDQFSPNPDYDDICVGVDLFKKENCDSIIAIGGGSNIDVAKCIRLYSAMDSSKSYLEQSSEGSNVPFIAIPTTAGSGSESTANAVIYYKGEKQSVASPCLLPDYAILDSSTLESLPLYQKKCTMLDALCQGIESWWSVNSTPESIEMAKRCVELVMKSWKSYIFDYTKEAAQDIMLAANLSGQAIRITKTTAPHAMGYKLTTLYGLPHGHSVVISLIEVWEYMLRHPDKCIDPRGKDYVSETFEQIARSMGVNHANDAIAILWKMLQIMSIQNPCVREDRQKEITMLTSSVNPARLKNNPIGLESKDIRTLYERILK